VANLDISSPGFVVTVIATNPVLRIKGKTDPNALGQVLERMTDVTERVVSFTYEDAEKEQDILKLQLDNSDLYFLEHPAWVKGNVVKFVFGYPGRIFGPRFAVVDSVRGFLTLDINCVEDASLSNKAKCRKFEKMTRTEVVSTLVTERAFGKNVSVFRYQKSPADDEGKKDWQQARQSNWNFVQRLAEKVGYEVYVEGAELVFLPRRLDRRPDRRYEYFYGVGDLLDFTIKEWRVADRASETRVAGRDPVAKKNIESTGSNENTARSTTGNQNSLQITRGAGGTLDTVSGSQVHTTPETNQTAVTNEANTHFNRQEQGEVKASAKIIGDPLLAAKSMIEIVGISAQLSGKYYVTKHIHEISRSSGYTGKLELLKNATTSTPTSQPPTLDQSKANENRKPVADDRKLVIRRDVDSGSITQERQ